MAMGSVVSVRPRVDMEQSTLGMPVSNHQVETVLLIDGPNLRSNVPMLINVVELKARKVRFIQAMKLVMLAPKAWRLVPGNCKQQRLAFVLKLLQHFQAVIQVLNNLKGDDRVVLIKLNFVDVSMNKLCAWTPTLLVSHIHNDGVVSSPV